MAAAYDRPYRRCRALTPTTTHGARSYGYDDIASTEAVLVDARLPTGNTKRVGAR